MNVGSVLGRLFRRRSSEGRTAAEFTEPDQPIRLPPTVTADELPPEFEDILQLQVLGYRERLLFVDERRQRVLDPVWTLVPKDR